MKPRNPLVWAVLLFNGKIINCKIWTTKARSSTGLCQFRHSLSPETMILIVSHHVKTFLVSTSRQGLYQSASGGSLILANLELILVRFFNVRNIDGQYI